MKFSLRGDKEKSCSAKKDDHRTVAVTELESNKATRVGVYLFAIVVFVIGFAAVLTVSAALVGGLSAISVVIALFVGLLAAGSIRIAPRWLWFCRPVIPVASSFRHRHGTRAAE